MPTNSQESERKLGTPNPKEVAEVLNFWRCNESPKQLAQWRPSVAIVGRMLTLICYSVIGN